MSPSSAAPREPAAGAAHILTLNAGSSSIKYALFALHGAPGERVVAGQVEGLGGGAAPHADALRQVITKIGDARVVAVGHRIVHGGVRFDAPVRIDDDVTGGGELREGIRPPVYDVWVRNGKGQDVIKGTATVKPAKGNQ